MSTNISMQTTTTFGDRGQPSHYLPGPRPDDLPISAAVWDVAKSYGKDSAAVIMALYEAVKKLEARPARRPVMSGLDEHVIKWWNRLNDDQRSRVKHAAEYHRLDAAGVRALIDTRCPVGPVGTRWDADPEYAWTWPESLRQFVLDQQ